MAAVPPFTPQWVTHLLYLHGFRSSPQSAKARLVAARMAGRHPHLPFWCPQLPPSPREAMQMLMRRLATWPASGIGVIGSSLGGFYATHLAETLGCRAVVLNPAVNPARDLARHIGEQTLWHDPGQRFYFEPRFVDELRELEHPQLREPRNYLLVAATGDEVLDWREMRCHYAGARARIIQGGDHGLSDFERHLDEVFAFLGLG